MRLTRAILLLVTTTAGIAAAQDNVGPSPLLQQLDRETRRLHESVQASVVRVQLPPPKWVEEMLSDEHPARKWKDLDPQVRSRLEQQRRGGGGAAGDVGVVLIPPATQPADAPTSRPGEESWRITSGPDQSVTLESRIDKGDSRMLIVKPRTGEDGAGLRVEARPGASFMPNNIAIVLDDAGHLLVPIYLERDQLTQPVNVSVGGEAVTTATFVGSDRQTGLTLLKAHRATGKPARLSTDARPAPGSLVMILSPNAETARLSVWTGGANEWGVVVAMDGTVAGFARHGQFLGGGLTAPVVKQLIETGSVRRPTLGVVVSEVRADDPLRREHPALGTRPAMHIRQVLPESPAARAGLREGDLILAIDGKPVGDIPTFAATIAQCAGDARLTCLRADEPIEVAVRFDPISR